jgi:diguanylate cyclase (GGDEF)-like protein
MPDREQEASLFPDSPQCAEDWSARVLVAEDDAAARGVLELLLPKWGYNVLAVDDGAQAWGVLQSRDAPRLALLDWTLPEMEGIEVCRRVRENSKRPYTYILLLAASGQKQDLFNALHGGADDYLVKPFDAAELRARLYVGRRILAAQDELIAAREALRFQATHDPLTGLWNHGESMRILDREVARSNRAQQPISLLMVDLDHFKQVNDARGHLVGDEVLAEVSRRLLASVRPYDAVGRCGGEEFVIVVPGAEGLVAAGLAERIVTHLRDRPFGTSAGPVRVTASVGVTFGSPAKSLSAIDLIRAADVALYRAKQNGRNRTEISFPEELAPQSTQEAAPPTPADGVPQSSRH